MRRNCSDRCIEIAEYVIETHATVRACASKFGVSKSTVHKDLTQKLRYLSRDLFEKARKILDENKSERHIRGGEATKRKYITKKAK